MQTAKARGRPEGRASSRRRTRRGAGGRPNGEAMALRQVEVSAEELDRARARADAQAREIDREVRAAVTAAFARAAKAGPASVSVRLGGDLEHQTLERVRRDAKGRVVLHEFAHRSDGRLEYARTEWREGSAHRQNLVSVVDGLRLRREERWQELPTQAVPEEEPFGQARRRRDGAALEHTYLLEGSARVHRLYSQQRDARLSVTARFDVVHGALPALLMEEGFDPARPVTTLTLHERRRADGAPEQELRTSVWAQGQRRVTHTEQDGRKAWRCEQQLRSRYKSRAFTEGAGAYTTVERTAAGRQVDELTTLCSGGERLQQRAELAFDARGALERCVWTQTEAGGARLEQRYRRLARLTERGLEIFESEQATRAEPSPTGKLPTLWRSSRQTHHLQRGALQRLLSLSEQIVDPQQNRVQAVLDGMHAWVVVNGRTQPLSGDEVRWFRSLPARERALAVHALQDLTRHVKLRAAHGEDGLALLPAPGAGQARLYKWEERLEELSTSSLVQLVFRHPSLKAGGGESLEGLRVLSQASVALAERLHALFAPQTLEVPAVPPVHPERSAAGA